MLSNQLKELESDALIIRLWFK
ncbi:MULTISPECIES: hypothetical protein [Lacrimispora]|uniref:Uncharacterized protein n=1 Tax=Lacrimispora xylanolytica TaxID=29375 RepID=A0ABY7AKI3_9FIRM|nr:MULTISPECIES: hypothetical protein [Clostridia]WAJ25986.1 hypothetical protein OW255_07635 [Lacrimispora xylanolytica]